MIVTRWLPAGRARTWMVLAAGLLVPAHGVTQSIGQSARANIILSFDFDFQDAHGSQFSDGHFVLGINTVEIPSEVLDTDVLTLERYSDNAQKLGGDRIAAQFTSPDLGPNARAESKMSSKPARTIAGTLVQNAYDYKMSVDAVADTNRFLFFGGRFFRSLTATAEASDPQPLSVGGQVGATVTLDPGSAMFAASDAPSEARAEFGFTAPLLDRPIVSVALGRVGDVIDATVELASAPGLQILDAAAGQPLTAAVLEALLEGTPQLWTFDGLVQSLPLFAYRYDLTGAALPADAALGSYARASALAQASQPQSRPLPEPGAAWLVLAGMLVVAPRKRGAGALRPR